MKTLLEDLDTLCEIENGELIALGARPAMGKSSLALTIAINFAKQGKKVSYFSYDTKKNILVRRCLSIISEVEIDLIPKNLENLKTMPLLKVLNCSKDSVRCFKEEEERLNEAVDIFNQLPFNITTPIEEQDFESSIVNREGIDNCDIIIIDYLQLLVSNKIFQNRVEELDYICRELKLLAIRIDKPIVLLSQLNRKVEERQGHRPMPTDFKDVALEECADKVLFLLRREYYDPMDKPGLGELIVSKNRNGRIGSVNVVFRKEITQFANYVPLRWD